MPHFIGLQKSRKDKTTEQVLATFLKVSFFFLIKRLCIPQTSVPKRQRLTEGCQSVVN